MERDRGRLRIADILWMAVVALCFACLLYAAFIAGGLDMCERSAGAMVEDGICVNTTTMGYCLLSDGGLAKHDPFFNLSTLEEHWNGTTE